LNITHLLAIANALLLLAAAGVGWDATRRYGDLVYDFNARNAQQVADAAVSDLAWREYAQWVTDIGRHIAQADKLRKLVSEKNAAAIQADLTDEFGRGAISSGQVKVLGLSVYDPDLGLIGASWRGTAGALPAAVKDAVAKRTGTERLKIMWRVWQHGGEPRLTAFVPVGGLRLTGYVGVHADPIHALASLDQRLGMAIEIRTLDGDRALLRPDNFKIPADAAVRQTELIARTPAGEPVARLKVTQNVTELARALDARALLSFAAFLLICGGIAAGAVAVVAQHIRKVSRREAAAHAELDRERRKKAEADEARLEAQRDAEAARRGDLLRLADTFEASVKSVVDFVSTASSETAANAETLAAAARRALDLAGAAASASGQAATTVQTVTSASQELSRSTGEITQQVSQSSRIAGRAVTEANETNKTMRGLADAATRIGDVVNLIKTIAAQTNLLALNATIEAARAGEAGRGFAVVAAEVKSLATQTAKATEEITGQVTAIQASMRDATAAIDLVGKTINEISGIAAGVAGAVDQQGAATRDIAHNAETAASGARDVAANIGGAREAAEESGRVAALVLGASRDLAQRADGLRHEVERFLSTVRAA
jgi:methyl-accepting chemotaxis protein